MKRLAVVALVLGGSLAAAGATATAALTSATVHLDPAPTSVDRGSSCELPARDAAPTAPGPGVTVISFTIFPAGC